MKGKSCVKKVTEAISHQIKLITGTVGQFLPKFSWLTSAISQSLKSASVFSNGFADPCAGTRWVTACCLCELLKSPAALTVQLWGRGGAAGDQCARGPSFQIAPARMLISSSVD